MSRSEPFVQDHRRHTDRAIHHAYAHLEPHPPVLEKFHQLLHCARTRAPRLFDAPILTWTNAGEDFRRHAGVTALVNLARYQHAHLRPIAVWSGSQASWRPAIASLANHLLCEYKVPTFLASAWYAYDESADKKRQWFLAHANGASFRSLNLPIAMTRKMEHLFLASSDHLSIERAMRQAELHALGSSPECINAILATQLATDLNHGEFWRTLWLFLIENAADVDPNQIGPIIDYLHAIRHHHVTVETPEGTVSLGPPQPAFSLKGRTVPSLLRLVQAWHRSLGASGPNYSWAASPFAPLHLTEPSRDHPETPTRWLMLELTNSAQLRSEGAALRHCVATYATRCYRGASSIWSLRLWQGEKVQHVLTVEVDPRKRAIVQARGRANRAASGKSLQLLQHWATRERLQITL